MPNQPKTPIRGIRIEDELWEALKLKAERDDTTASEIIRQAIREAIEDES